MKKLAAITLTIIGALFVSAGVDAQCRTVVRVQQQTYQAHAAYQAHAYVAPVVAAVYQAIPVYNVGYAPDNKEELQLLRIQLLQFQQQFLTFQQQQLQPVPQQLPPPREQFRDTPRQQLSPQPPPLPPAQKIPDRGVNGPHPAVAIMNRACAACHTDTVAKAKGGGFVLFVAGGIAPLTDKQAFSIAKEAFSGRMPKNGKLSDSEVGEVMDWLDTVK